MEKIIVIYIDIDDDLGRIGLQTPLIGEEEVKKAIEVAEQMIPTDSDFNAMIVARNIYKKLKEEGKENVEIAFISGSDKGSLDSQLAFSEKLDKVVEKVKPTSAVIVYDSPEDAKAIPIIQSKLKIIGIERVLVEQYRGVEETYALLARYLKKALSEPRYSRIFLGVPGLIFLIFGLFSLLNLTAYLGPIILMVIGSAFVIRGLGIDDLIEKWWENSTIMVIIAIIAIISFIAGIINGYLVFENVRYYATVTYVDIALSMSPYFVFSIIILIGGKAINKIVNRDIRVWHDIYKIFSVVIIYYIIVVISKNIETNVYELQLQTIYSLSITTFILITVYIILSLLEKYRFIT
ncbi:hypothetical protein DDW09_00545 [Sulfolobus sp. SCGC AB-777_L09]|nr:hypothetical protein DDW09_00545 [Sulfolobus sp. SCGC AB-777_L09]